MTVDVETLRGLRALAGTLVERLDEALAGVTPTPDDDLAGGRTPAAVVELLRRRGPMRPGAIAAALQEAGRVVSEDAVYQACSRLARAGTLRRGMAGYEVVKGEEEGGPTS